MAPEGAGKEPPAFQRLWCLALVIVNCLKAVLVQARVLPEGAGETHFVVYGEQVKGPGAGLVRQQT